MIRSLLLLLSLSASSFAASQQNCSFWLEDIQHQGIAAFNPNSSSFQVFRNVKDFGAVGDGSSDDTAAINRAISIGNTCAPGSCLSSTNRQALVYFPAGTYMVTSTIIQNYGVTLYGNPNCKPTIKASSNFTNGPGQIGLIDGNPNNPATGMSYTNSDNIFYRQLRNFVIDTTLVVPQSNITGIHWPSAQATTLQNVVFNMPTTAGVNHTGLIVDAGGMLLFSDLVFNGGLNGFYAKISQIVMRNLTFNGCVNGINFAEVWSLSASQMHFNNCTTGIRNVIGNGTLSVIDSYMNHTQTGIASNYGGATALPASNTIILENLQIEAVPIVVQNAGNVSSLMGTNGTSSISGYGQGNSYTGATPGEFAGPITPVYRPIGLRALKSNDWYFRAKPSYETLPLSSFVSARSAGAKGDGYTDDTKTMQAAIYSVANSSKVLFLDQGSYKITSTLHVPSNTKIVGEALPKIFAAGSFFANMSDPQPLLRVGSPGEKGSMEFSDFILATQGSTPGAVLVEHNLASDANAVSGYWDIDTLIGGWAGSQLSVGDCPTTPQVVKPPVNESCLSTFISMHITPSASGVYMENCWFWGANQDIDDFNVTYVQVFAGRGLLVESEVGNNWFVCAAVEHHSKYQFNMANTKNVYMDQTETESPYYQPNPNASYPYPYDASLHDPLYTTDVPLFNSTVPVANSTVPIFNSSDPVFNTTSPPILASTDMAWSQVITNSSDITIYSTAFFSWFLNWGKGCTSNHTCQQSALSIDAASHGINIYAFTYGNMQNAILSNGTEIIPYLTSEGRPNSIAIFKQ